MDQALTEAAQRGLETEKIVLSQHRISPCQGHDDCASFPRCQQNDDAGWILEKFQNADGIILGSPVYYSNMSAQMKAFIDRCVFLYTHEILVRARSVGLIVVAGGGGLEDTIEALKRALSAHIDSDKALVVSGYASKLGEVKTNLSLVQKARELGRLMADQLLNEAS